MGRPLVVAFLAVVIACPACAHVSDGAAEGAPGGRPGIPGQCALIGEPRIERVSEHVWVAIGYDLANQVIIHTDDGNVVVDTLMSRKRALPARRDLLGAIPGGRVKAVVYTHSHIDHIGGASLWVEEGTEIWATDSFASHLYKQYGVFLPVELMRGRRQFGEHAPEGELPCNGIGRRADIEAARDGTGLRLPTHTFSGTHSLHVGGIEIRLIEAPGETHDQLVVWIPADRTLIAADDFYWAFPNLYTIRGASPRPVDDWIKSIDMMRRLDPEHLVPCHTVPVHGSAQIARVLTNYRDAIQWVRDETIRLSNKGLDMDAIAESVKLPAHLANLPYLQEVYGQSDWSARAVYTNNLGWFDGRPERLYPMPVKEAARREIALMGGPDKVYGEARQALDRKEYRWALHLLTKLKDSGLPEGKDLAEALAEGYEGLAMTLGNLNGRGYLLECAHEMRHGIDRPGTARITDEVASSIPLETIFSVMATRLVADKAMDVHKAVVYEFTDVKRRFVVTVRHGVAEVVEGDSLPGTPDPVATLRTDALTFRRLAAKSTTPLKALAAGKLTVEGSWIEFVAFVRLFDLD